MPTYTSEAIKKRLNELLTLPGWGAREVERRIQSDGGELTVSHSHISHIASGLSPRPSAEKLEAISIGFGFRSLDAMMAPDAVERVKHGTQAGVNGQTSGDAHVRALMRQEAEDTFRRLTGEKRRILGQLGIVTHVSRDPSGIRGRRPVYAISCGLLDRFGV